MLKRSVHDADPLWCTDVVPRSAPDRLHPARVGRNLSQEHRMNRLHTLLRSLSVVASSSPFASNAPSGATALAPKSDTEVAAAYVKHLEAHGCGGHRPPRRR